MKGHIRGFSKYLGLIFTFSFIIVFNVKSGDSLSLQEVVKINSERIKNLDYFQSDTLSLILPNKKEYVFKFFKGSGDLLKPITAVTPEIIEVDEQTVQEKSEQNGEQYQFTIGGLAKVVAKNKIKSFVKEEFEKYKDSLPSFGWLLDSQINPVTLVFFKIMMLMKYPFDEKDMIRRKVEIIRLFFRLSQSKLQNFVDKDKSIYDYLPLQLKNILQNSLPLEWQKFIDDMWKDMGKGFDGLEFLQDGSYDKEKIGTFVDGYVFDNFNLAQECFKKMNKKSDMSKTDFENEVEKNVASGYKIDNYNNFTKYKGLAYFKYVGKKDFGRIQKDSKNEELPQMIKDKILSNDQYPKIELIKVSDKESWIIFASNKLFLTDSIKLVLAALVKGVKEYQDIRPKDEDLQKENTDSSTSEKDAEKLELLYAQRESFKSNLKSLEGEAVSLKIDLQKKEKNPIKSKLDKDLLSLVKNDYEKVISKIDSCKKESEEVEKQIRGLEKNPYTYSYGFLKENDNEKLKGLGIGRLIIDIFSSCPELSEMFNALNSGLEHYKPIKEKLLKRVGYVLRDNENFVKNLEIYQYFIKTMVPEFSKTFEELIKNAKNNDQIYDSLISSFGL